MQPWFLLFPRPTNNDTYHSKRALKRLGRARSHWVYILLAITRSWLHNRESGYLSLSRLSQRAGSGKKAGCSSLCKRLADVYHRAGQNNYKLFNMSRRLVGLPNCKAKGPSGRVVFFFLRLSLSSTTSAQLSSSTSLFLSRVSFFVRSSYSWRITKLDREPQGKREEERAIDPRRIMRIDSMIRS